MNLVHLLVVLLCITYAFAYDAETQQLRQKLVSLQKEHSLIEQDMQRLSASVGGWKRPDEFSMKELDAMQGRADKLTSQMREVYSGLHIREAEQKLRNFASLLENSYKDQGFEKDFEKVKAEAKLFAEVPHDIQFVTLNFHAKDSKDKDSKKITEIEKQYLIHTHAFDWLLRNSYRPIPDFQKTLNDLNSQRAGLQSFLGTKVVGNPNSNLLEAQTEAEVETEADAEAETEAEGEAEAEAETETETETEAEAETETPASFMETEADAEEESHFPQAVAFAETEAETEVEAKTETQVNMDALIEESDFDGRLDSEAELMAEAEFGAEVSDDALASEAQELDRMEAQMKQAGML